MFTTLFWPRIAQCVAGNSATATPAMVTRDDPHLPSPFAIDCTPRVPGR